MFVWRVCYCFVNSEPFDWVPCLFVFFQEGTAGRAKGIQEEKSTEESAEDERVGTRERRPEIQMAAVQ